MNYRLAQVFWVIAAVILGCLALSQLPDAVSSQSPAYSLMVGLIDAAGAAGCMMMALCSKSFHKQQQNNKITVERDSANK